MIFKRKGRREKMVPLLVFFVTSGRWQSPCTCSTVCPLWCQSTVRGCVWHQSLGLGEGLGHHKISRASVTWKHLGWAVVSRASLEGFQAKWYPRGLEPDPVTACFLLSGKLRPMVSDAQYNLDTGSLKECQWAKDLSLVRD